MPYTDRLIEAYRKIINKDWINSLIQICINLDAVAKKKYGGKPGKRIKKFIRENQYILTRIATVHFEVHGNMIFQVNGKKEMKFEEIIYKLIRCALLHEGDLDSRVKIVESSIIGLDKEGKFLLSKHLIVALFLLLVSDMENQAIQWPNKASFTIGNKTVKFNEIKGNVNKLIEIFRDISKKESNLPLQ